MAVLRIWREGLTNIDKEGAILSYISATISFLAACGYFYKHVWIMVPLWIALAYCWFELGETWRS